MEPTPTSGWEFIDDQGTFEIADPQNTSYLYLPLVNQAGMMSSVTPGLNGDAKTGQDAFLLLPVSVEDLHNSRSARNFWVTIDDLPWSVTGNSAAQAAQRFNGGDEAVSLQAGMLWQTVRRDHPGSGLRAEVTSFVPAGEDRVELMRVVLTNCGERDLALTSTAAIPIFGRSADNLRDHRHVTSLLHRTTCHPFGVLVRPSLSFKEGGHSPNRLTYAVLGADGDGRPPEGFFPRLEDFIGEGGALDWPAGVVGGLAPAPAGSPVPAGCESIGALRFASLTLQPGRSISYVLLLAIAADERELEALLARYASAEKFARALEATQANWSQNLTQLHFACGDARFDGWLQWVSLQPALRRLMGNSFLPYHDYGRGGRGWRDLWQDALALLLTESRDLSDQLLGNFAGVRMDGSNANIIGTRPGEFKADRNNLARVWMDHGAWPLLTVKHYLDLSGDLDFLLRPQAYFKDRLADRCRAADSLWTPEQGTRMRTAAGEEARGSVLEHLLVQHLTACHNLGAHGSILLEGGDWNDALDMAGRQGESVAFTALYAANLRTLGELCLALASRGVGEVHLAAELGLLLGQGCQGSEEEPEATRARLEAYFERVRHVLSGDKLTIPLEELAGDLLARAGRLAAHIRDREWLTDGEGQGWFNGYYDDDGCRVEGVFPAGVRMTLTGQVFTLMGGVASDQQASQVTQAVERYLYDEQLGGYRLNTDFGDQPPPLGRIFGFAYGHKENGAMFNHMSVMYAHALYRRGLVRAGWRVLEGIYGQCRDFLRSRIYPGIPEYFDPRGRGMYPYLTGSAAWYLFTLLAEVYGVKGRLGDLVLEPKLTAGQFDETECLAVQTVFAGKDLDVTYCNPRRLEYGAYGILSVSVDGRELPLEAGSRSLVISRQELAGWPEQVRIRVLLGA
jgi:cellobiose phosphorylase